MELVIDIPEGEYGTIKQFEKLGKYSDKNDVGQRALSRIANSIPLEQIRNEIDRLHYHPKLDFIKNDEVVEMALDIIDKQIGAIRNE